MSEPSGPTKPVAIVIGSGFGGAVASCRLALAGFDVTILERGRRYAPGDFPSVPNPGELLPDSSRWVFGHDHGLWDVTDLGPLRAVQAAGYGGGSLVYANVHLRPDPSALSDWPEAVRTDLFDRYYDVAAAMLDVQTYPASFVAITPKADALRKSAIAMKRTNGYFDPPLAIHFEDGADAFGAVRRKCSRCGSCCSGCNVGAKNTLDHNYLLVAERAGAKVRTLTEVVRIRPNTSGVRYTVEARDHLRGGEIATFDSDHVFLCAGAVHSTRLLAESLPGDALPELGKRFFGNADAIGMIYGASQSLHPEIGPTITGAILYDERGRAKESAKPHWFMIQDGGYTKSLEHLFGVMRAPILGDRNRFLESSTVPKIDPLVAIAKPPDACDDVVGHASASLTTTFFRGITDALFVRKLVPPQLFAFVETWLKGLRHSETDIIEKTIVGLPDRYVDAYRAAYVADHGEGSDTTLRGRFFLWIAKLYAGAIRKSVRQPRMLRGLRDGARDSFERTLGLADGPNVFLEETIRHGLGLGRATGSTVRWDPDVGVDPARRMMLLAMGDDGAFPRELSMVDGRLQATERGDESVYAIEERLMRDVAASVGGELRVNPLYAMQRETITVHAQGGCGMGADSTTSVTSPEGEVHGYPGLFVMDASVFPSPVGVNPSATIAALAERNVRSFIAKHTGPGRGALSPVTSPTIPTEAAIAAWWKARNVAPAKLSPPSRLGSPPPVNQPVGLSFDEVMRGFVVAASAAPKQPADYERLANDARSSGLSIALKLGASIPDVGEFAASPEHRLGLRGAVELVEQTSRTTKTFELDPEGSWLELMTPILAGSARTMTYRLRGADFSLAGTKVIRDDAGFDSWEDTTRLFVDAELGGVKMSGIARLSMEDFVGSMLPSFVVTGTSDPARQAWALATFGGFFFSSLQKVYLPMLPDLSRGFGGGR